MRKLYKATKQQSIAIEELRAEAYCMEFSCFKKTKIFLTSKASRANLAYGCRA